MAVRNLRAWNSQTRQWQDASEVDLLMFAHTLSLEGPKTAKAPKTTDTQPLSGSNTIDAPAAGDNPEKE